MRRLVAVFAGFGVVVPESPAPECFKVLHSSACGERQANHELSTKNHKLYNSQEEIRCLGKGLFLRGTYLMVNGNPVGPEEKRPPQKKQAKKPYTKPAFRFERVFETQALSCGKVHSHGTPCKLNPKTS
jgi:hypothetical protein